MMTTTSPTSISHELLPDHPDSVAGCARQRSAAIAIMAFMALLLASICLVGSAYADDDDDDDDDLKKQTITFPSIADRVFSPTPFTVSPTSSAKLTVRVSSLTPTICSATGSNGRTITMLRSGLCTLNATQKGDDDYRAAKPVSRSFRISLAPQSISFAAISDRNFSNTSFTVAPTSSAGLTVGVTSMTPSVCTATGTSGRTITMLGAGLCNLRATQPGDTRYQSAPPVERSFIISMPRAAQSISFGAIASRPYSATLFAVSATSSAGLAVSIASITPAVCSVAAGPTPTTGAWPHAITMLSTGTCSLQATQAGDAAFNAATPVQQSFIVTKATQTIDFAPLPPRDLISGSFVVLVSASSGLIVMLSSDTPSVCSASNNTNSTAIASTTVTINLLTTGTCRLTAAQAGNALYDAAPAVSQSFAVGSGIRSQTITGFSPPSSVMYAAPPANTLVLTAVGGASGNPVVFSSSTPLVCDPSGSVVGSGNQSTATLTILATGTCTLSATQAGSSAYSAAPAVGATVLIEKANQTITGFSLPSSLPYAPAPNNTLVMAAQGGASTNPVVFTSTTESVCTTSGTNGATLTILATGVCTLTANQAGDANYNAAPAVTANITITKASQTISFSPPSSVPFAPAAPGNTIVLSATASSGLPVRFAATSPSVCTTSGEHGATLTVVSAGTCTLTADQAGNDNFNPAQQVSVSITITKASQVITNFSPPTTISQAVGSTLTLSATGGGVGNSGSGNPVTFSTTTPAVCTAGGTNGATLTIQSAGTCSVAANQAGNDNYNPALAVTVTISITVPAQLYFIHSDHLGTPRAITKASDNTKVWEWKNDDPFGTNLPDENPNSANTSAFKYNLRFPGQYYDEETGTHYNYFRDYDPSTGRYVQSDPIGLAGGISTYSYGAANPIRHFDERGLAYFAKRPLKNAPWLGMASCSPEGSPDDRNNTEISHEHLFFEDGKQPANQGYGAHGIFTETKVTGYRCKSRKYDDCLMRKAVARVTPKPYCLLGKPGQPKYNCQDWADSVREEYAKLEQDAAAKKECECAK